MAISGCRCSCGCTNCAGAGATEGAGGDAAACCMAELALAAEADGTPPAGGCCTTRFDVICWSVLINSVATARLTPQAAVSMLARLLSAARAEQKSGKVKVLVER